MTDTITQLQVEHLHESPFNPRTIFDEAALQELATDIQRQGRVLSPLLVRPRIGPLFQGVPGAEAGYEIVFGHRRFRAAQTAGLLDVPCMVRAMSDDEARRAQISENLQRKDVHPIEEAEGFQALIESNSHTADEIADEFGKSRSYVYGRLKLLNAIPEVRKMCLLGQIGAEVALLIARLGAQKMQLHAIEFIRKDYRYSSDLTNGGVQSFRHLRDLLSEKFTLSLKDAIFPLEDEMLVPAAGHCIRCVKRTGNAPEFHDITHATKPSPYSRQHFGADVCTDPVCFDEKKKAHLKREAAALVAQGKTVIQGGKARQVVDSSGNVKNGYIKLSEVRDAIKAAGTKSTNLPIVTIQNPRDGKTVQAVKADDLAAAGVKTSKPKSVAGGSYSHSNGNYEKEQAAKRVKAELETKVRTALFHRVLDTLTDQPRDIFDLQLLAMYSLDMLGYDNGDCLRAAYGVKRNEDLKHLVPDMLPGELSRLMLATALSHEVEINAWELEAPAQYLMTAAKQYGVDVKQVRAEITGTPAPAARAKKSAKADADKAAPADDDACLERTSKHIAKSKAKIKQKDNAGVAGGSDGQADLLEEAGA